MRVFLLVVVALLALHFTAVPSVNAQGGTSICGRYTSLLFGNDSVANESALITAIVTRAVLGGTFGTAPNTYTVNGLFASSGPLYAVFSGQIPYRSNPPNYTNTASTDFGVLAGHLVSYFGALFGCQVGAPGGIASVHSSDMYGIHKNMGITNTMETYFNTALATTLQSFGVSSIDVGTAGVVLSLFNRYGSPIQSATVGNNYISSSTSGGLTQICGDSSCPNATNANYALYQSAAGTVQVSAALLVALIALVSAFAL